jgi:inositol oxygenase
MPIDSATSKKKLGIALVGLGRSGHFHLTSIKSLPHVATLQWVVDIDEVRCKAIAADMGCRWSSNLMEPLTDPAVDIVIIASTTDTHFGFIIQSLKAKKAVFAEKPISHTVSEVQEAVDLALEFNLPFVCGYQRRCDRNFMALKRQVEAGAVGTLKVIKSCSRDNPLPPLEYLRTSGGIFQDMLIHDFDMQDWLSGGQVPESIHAVGHCYNEAVREMGDLDTVAVVAKYASGLITMTDTCRDAAYGYDQRVEAFGEKGMLTARNELVNTVELATGAGHLMPPAQWSFPERYKDAYRVELTEFLELVLAGPHSDLHQAEQKQMLRHPRIVKTATAAELSWRLGRQVLLSEDLDKLMEQTDKEHDDAASESTASTAVTLTDVEIPALLAPSEFSPEVAGQKLSLEAFHDWKPEQNAFGDSFRNYEDSKRQDIVKQTYYTMHAKQTVEFGRQAREKWLKFDKGEFTIMEMIALLDNLVDDSDPDNDLPNSIHDFQTAERIREQWPDHDWFHLVGLLHDIGKVLALPEVAGDAVLEQWAVVGDTFPVGCAPSDECVFGLKSFEDNPDLTHPEYSSEHGMYKPGCGMSNLMMSWGHDEYMYCVLKENSCTIPEEGLAMIRFHSFYPWHDRGAYTHFEAPEDAEMMKWVKEFNKFDLYSKGDAIPDVKALKPYYQSLLEKYGIGGKLRW